jgi:putative SOS response-associated peptidase YedK
VLLRWGLVPFWSSGPDSGYRMINARAETVAEKPAFRAAFRRRRCLIPADGFYEWRSQGPGKAKQPYWITLAEGGPMTLAGLWEHWEGEGGETVESCTILVGPANERMAPLHDRMPVILAPSDRDLWLDPGMHDPAALRPLLRPYPSEGITTTPVGRRVNSPANEGPELIAPETE